MVNYQLNYHKFLTGSRFDMKAFSFLMTTQTYFWVVLFAWFYSNLAVKCLISGELFLLLGDRKRSALWVSENHIKFLCVWQCFFMGKRQVWTVGICHRGCRVEALDGRLTWGRIFIPKQGLCSYCSLSVLSFKVRPSWPIKLSMAHNIVTWGLGDT